MILAHIALIGIFLNTLESVKTEITLTNPSSIPLPMLDWCKIQSESCGGLENCIFQTQSKTAYISSYLLCFQYGFDDPFHRAVRLR